jgi:hypothetical protein
MAIVRGDFKVSSSEKRKHRPSRGNYVMGDFEQGMGFIKIKMSTSDLNPFKALKNVYNATVKPIVKPLEKVVATAVKNPLKAPLALATVPLKQIDSLTNAVGIKANLSKTVTNLAENAWRNPLKAPGQVLQTAIDTTKNVAKVQGQVLETVYKKTGVKDVVSAGAGLAEGIVKNPGRALKDLTMHATGITSAMMLMDVAKDPSKYLKDPSKLVSDYAKNLDTAGKERDKQKAKDMEAAAYKQAEDAYWAQFEVGEYYQINGVAKKYIGNRQFVEALQETEYVYEEGSVYDIDGKYMIYKNGQLVPYEQQGPQYQEGAVYQAEDGSYVQYLNGKFVPYNYETQSIQYEEGNFYQTENGLHYFKNGQLVPWQSQNGELLFDEYGSPMMTSGGEYARTDMPEVTQEIINQAVVPEKAKDPIVTTPAKPKTNKGLMLAGGAAALAAGYFLFTQGE